MAGPRQEWSALEPLGQAGEEGAPQTELRVANPDPGAVADLVDLVEHVEEVETQLEALVQSGLDRLNHAEIHLLITGQARPVRAPAGAGGPEATAGSKMGGKQRTGRRHPVFDAGRIGVGLIVVEVDIVAGDKGKLVRGEIELGRSNLLAERLRCGEIAVK